MKEATEMLAELSASVRHLVPELFRDSVARYVFVVTNRQPEMAVQRGLEHDLKSLDIRAPQEIDALRAAISAGDRREKTNNHASVPARPSQFSIHPLATRFLRWSFPDGG